MNNKAHLKPKDYDSNGDIIPSGWKEEKGDLISREALKKALHNFFDGKVIDEPAYILRDVFCQIDGTPAVETYTKEDMRKEYQHGITDAYRDNPPI